MLFEQKDLLVLPRDAYEHVLNIAVFALLADSSKENPYEDIELDSQCSQQSLPSSPGADSTKVPTAQAQHKTLRLCLKYLEN